jgi:hypothetical protein
MLEYLQTALLHKTMLRASELEPHMIVSEERDGSRATRVVIGVYIGPFDDANVNIVEWLFPDGLTDLFIYQPNGKLDDPRFSLLGWKRDLVLAKTIWE